MIEALKPYPAYRATRDRWLTHFPSTWERVRIKYLLREIDRRTQTGEEPLLSMRRDHGLVPLSQFSDKVTEPKALLAYKLVEPGELVVNRMQAGNGLVFVARIPGLISPDYAIFRRVRDVNLDYLELLFRSYPMRAKFRSESTGLGTGTAGFLRLYGDSLGAIEIGLPSPEEQSRIVRFADHANKQIGRYIRVKKKLIALLNEQAQGIVHRTVTRGLDTNAPTTPSCLEWLDRVPSDWRRVRLKQVATIQTGITLGKGYGDTSLIERPYLRVANVQSGRVDLSKITTVRLPPAEAAGATLVAGDVLMTEGGDIDKLGRGCVWRGEIPECLHQNHVFAVRTDARRLLPEFLVAIMGSRHGRTYFQTTAKQTTNLAATNSTTLGNLPLWLPTTDVQLKILDRVIADTTEMNAAADRARSEIGLLHEYRSRLVADVVTGKTDVREAAAHLPDVPAPSEDEGLLADDATESDAAELNDAEEEVGA